MLQGPNRDRHQSIAIFVYSKLSIILPPTSFYFFTVSKKIVLISHLPTPRSISLTLTSRFWLKKIKTYGLKKKKVKLLKMKFSPFSCPSHRLSPTLFSSEFWGILWSDGWDTKIDIHMKLYKYAYRLVYNPLLKTLYSREEDEIFDPWICLKG